MINCRKYTEECLKIRDKESNVIIPMRYKPCQNRIYDALKGQFEAGLPRRVVILKARQMGVSTFAGSYFFHGTATNFDVRTAIVAHKDDATKNLFNMYKTFHQNLPDIIKPEKKASNAYELVFDNTEGTGLRSSIVCYTAGGQGIGRSSTLNYLHISEYAFWPGDKRSTLNGLLQAVPNTVNTCIIMESTANGYEQFKDFWDKAVAGTNGFIALFFAWFDEPGYKMTAPEDFTLTADEEDLVRLYNLSNDQLFWRRWCIANNCQGDLKMFKQEYPSNPEEAFISTGYSVFDNELVIKEIEKSRKIPYNQGYFIYSKKYIDKDNSEIDNESIKWRDDKRGYIKIYEQPIEEIDEEGNVIRIAPYCLGGDTSGGEETAEKDKDYFTACVVNNITKRTAATFRQQIVDEDLYADQMYCLGYYYHKALIGIETNYSIQPTRELDKMHYPLLYMRERYDTLKSIMVHAIGWETNVKTRPVAIGDLVKLFRLDPSVIVDTTTLLEMLTFVIVNRKSQATEGYHDDCVMARAIADAISAQQAQTWIDVKKKEDEDFLYKMFPTLKKNKSKKGEYISW